MTPLRPVTSKMRIDEFRAVERYAQQRQITISGAIRELIRTHPAIQMGSVLSTLRLTAHHRANGQS
jgi:hypothetical protein